MIIRTKIGGIVLEFIGKILDNIKNYLILTDESGNEVWSNSSVSKKMSLMKQSADFHLRKFQRYQLAFLFYILFGLTNCFFVIL